MENSRRTRAITILSSYLPAIQRLDRCMREWEQWERRAAIVGRDCCEEVFETLRRESAACAHDRAKAQALINTIQDERQRHIIELRFIDGLTVAEVCDKLFIDERWCFRLCKKAMETMLLSNILDTKE